MCLALYLFTDNLLDEQKFEYDKPDMYIRRIDLNREHAVLKWGINKKNIYYIGSSQGCGCGWSALFECDDENERLEKAKDRISLYSLLKQQNFTSSHLIICWEGDQGMEFKEIRTLDINDIKQTDFEIEELVDYTI